MASTAEKNLADSEPAPTRAAAMVESVLGCKWSLSVLQAIRDGAQRPGELERACPGISTKVLNERLRKLVNFGVLERLSYPEIPPRVEYSFTVEVLDRVAALQRELEGQAEPA